MLKFEWPLILPDNPDVKRVSEATYDICEYVVDTSKQFGLPDGMQPLKEGVSVHMACHARAQNMGAKSAEMLRLIPETPVDVIERCSGHGGTFGVLKPTHEVAMKVGRPTMRQVVAKGRGHVVSDCPLAAAHLVQGATEIAAADGKELPAKISEHPIEIMAQAYGLNYAS
jgi:glycerol-3-phosphate dehydrogenase subunit C